MIPFKIVQIPITEELSPLWKLLFVSHNIQHNRPRKKYMYEMKRFFLKLTEIKEGGNLESDEN